MSRSGRSTPFVLGGRHVAARESRDGGGGGSCEDVEGAIAFRSIWWIVVSDAVATILTRFDCVSTSRSWS
jgi:hypothetical protein